LQYQTGSTPELNHKTVVTGKNHLKIRLTCAVEIDSGSTARFSAYFQSMKDGAFNPTGIAAQVFEGAMNPILRATLTPIQDEYGIGSYFAEWNVPLSQGSGPVYVEWSGSYKQSDETSSQPIRVRQTIKVVNPL
jgi:hypothetical protein